MASEGKLRRIKLGHRSTRFRAEDLDRLVAAARSQTTMTHNNPEVLDSSEFFAKVAWEVLNGSSPLSAIEQITGTYGRDDPILGMVEDGLGSRDVNTRKPEGHRRIRSDV